MRCLNKCIAMISLAGVLVFATSLWAGQDVPSIKVPEAPQVDGSEKDATWSGVKPIAIVDTASGARILLRSVYTDDQVFFLVQYPDSVQNFLHKPWVWNSVEKKYETGAHREDTFVFKWNMMNKEVDLSSFSDDSYRADVWYWKANRTNPAGYADDKMQTLEDSAGKKSKEKSSVTGKKRHLSRLSDSGQKAYREYKPAEYEGNLVDAYPPAIPGGSRADVQAKGVWAGGFWTIEFARKFNTGNDDDVQFDPVSGNPYLFGVSIFSLYGNKLDKTVPNLYGMGRISEPLYLKFM